MWQLETNVNINPSVLEKSQLALTQILNRSDVGFKEIEHFQKAIEASVQHKSLYTKYKKLVIIGFGGSSLGTKALSYALFPAEVQNKLHFVDNVDADTIDQMIHQLTDLHEVGWVLCSKSGSTIEVLSLYEYFFSALKRAHNFSIIKNTIVITENRTNPLFHFAQQNSIVALDIPQSIGGRFSAFTTVGLFPVGLLGFNFDKSILGFEEALENKKLIVQLSALLFESQLRKESTFYSFQYSDRLFYWSLWLQQLWSESLSKKTNRKGEPAPINSTLVPCRGASDQHSVLQQVMQGRDKKLVGFHRIESSEAGKYKIEDSLFKDSLMLNKPIGSLLRAEVMATQKALSEEGVSTFCLVHKDLNETSITSLMTLWMLTTAVMGELMEINAFDQPGVESGKRIARRVLSDTN